ncbi:MAG: hypothetical protein H7A24_09070 [Leptospiraceae bacterium]|nr:hypothetical protein [Leptospiraceae bacterium]MCP5512020.1 hypothetical protein [Leptospiraceae bacterium]
MTLKHQFFLFLIVIVLLFEVIPLYTSEGSDSKKTIPVFISSNSTYYIKIINQIRVVLNRQMDLHFLSSLNEEETLALFQKIKSDSPDFLISLGNPSTTKVFENFQNVPILYSLLPAAALPKNLENNKICGVNTDIPIKEFFATLKEMKPESRKVLSFSGNQFSRFIASEGMYESSRYNLLFENIEVKSGTELIHILKEMKGGFDAIYIISDPIYDKETFDFVSEYCRENHIILMTSIPYLINLGATFSITHFYSRIGMVIGELGQEISRNPQVCRDNYLLPIREHALSINSEYAEKSGLAIPKHLIQRSENNHVILEGINQYEKGNLEISYLIMNKLLEKDPHNRTGIFFRDLINEKLNGRKISELFKKAKVLHQNKEYREEREILKKILAIYPSSIEANEAMENSLFSESESKRVHGDLMSSQNEVFLAIVSYLDAIKIYPKNEKAKSELSTLRAKEFKNIPKYRETAIRYYNTRNYEKAEETFSNILLIDPNDRQAEEYRKISFNKKKGMEKYVECIRKNDKKCSLIWKGEKEW